MKTTTLVATVIAALVLGVGLAKAAEPTIEDLRAQRDALAQKREEAKKAAEAVKTDGQSVDSAQGTPPQPPAPTPTVPPIAQASAQPQVSEPAPSVQAGPVLTLTCQEAVRLASCLKAVRPKHASSDEAKTLRAKLADSNRQRIELARKVAELEKRPTERLVTVPAPPLDTPAAAILTAEPALTQGVLPPSETSQKAYIAFRKGTKDGPAVPNQKATVVLVGPTGEINRFDLDAKTGNTDAFTVDVRPGYSLRVYGPAGVAYYWPDHGNMLHASYDDFFYVDASGKPQRKVGVARLVFITR